MRVAEVRDEIERRPFQPFKICMSDGSEHVVLNPDHVLLTKRTVHVGIPQDGEGLPEYAKYCDAVHITRIEPLEPAT